MKLKGILKKQDKTSITPVAIITAKADSQRLSGKNSLPLMGKPVAWWSVEASISAGLRTLVCTDLPWLADLAKSAGCEIFEHPNGQTHSEVIKGTLCKAGAEDSPCILLQPTSPFRSGSIIQRCVRRYEETGKSVFTVSVSCDARISDEKVIQNGRYLTFWDGCVAIFPPGGICRFSPAETVRNLPTNSLQIDTEEDYVIACAAAESFKQPQQVIPPQIAIVLREFLDARGAFGKRVSVVGRPGKIPDDCHVWHVNHCLGYSGGRCDGVIIVANKHLRSIGLSDTTKECLMKAKAVLVRDNGELEWLKKEVPFIIGKFLPIGAVTPLDDHLTTGAILVDLLAGFGCVVTLIGAFRPRSVLSSLIPFHYPAMSREISLLYNSGAIQLGDFRE